MVTDEQWRRDPNLALKLQASSEAGWEYDHELERKIDDMSTVDFAQQKNQIFARLEDQSVHGPHAHGYIMPLRNALLGASSEEAQREQGWIETHAQKLHERLMESIEFNKKHEDHPMLVLFHNNIFGAPEDQIEFMIEENNFVRDLAGRQARLEDDFDKPNLTEYNGYDVDSDEKVYNNAKFENFMEKVLQELKPELQNKLDNLIITYSKYPSPDQLSKIPLGGEHSLLGLFEGYSQKQRGQLATQLADASKITLFADAIEKMSKGDETVLYEQIRDTLMHEIAHYFGSSDADIYTITDKKKEKTGQPVKHSLPSVYDLMAEATRSEEKAKAALELQKASQPNPYIDEEEKMDADEYQPKPKKLEPPKARI